MGKDLPSTAGVPSPYPYPATPAIQSASGLYALVVPLYGAPTKLSVTPKAFGISGYARAERAEIWPWDLRSRERARVYSRARTRDRAILLGLAVSWLGIAMVVRGVHVRV